MRGGRRAVAALLLLGAAGPSWAKGAGTAGASILTLGVGARQFAMGEAAAAASGDAYALYWNPGGLAKMDGKLKVGTQYLSGFGGGNVGTVLGAAALPGIGTVAGQIAYASAGDLVYTDWAGAVQTVTAEKDLVVGAGYARSLGPVGVGAGVKFLRSALADGLKDSKGNDLGASASTLAFDVGAQASVLGKVRVGLVIQNLGPGLKFRNVSDALPLTIRGGGSVDLPVGAFTVTPAADLVVRTGDGVGVNIGCEGRREVPGLGPVALRAGYRIGQNAGALTAGAGVRYRMFSLDYGAGLLGTAALGPAHRISFSLSF